MYLFIVSFLLIIQFVQAESNFRNIIAFGDSYTDNGSFSKFYKNGTFKITDSCLHPSTSEISRESNSLLWVEHLAKLFDDALLYDFARSGATATNDFIPRPPEDMSMQVNAYIRSNAPKEQSIYFLWTGVNDIFDLFKVFPKNNIFGRYILQGVMDSIANDLTRLNEYGANHIVLMGLIPLETAPFYQDISNETKFELRKLVSDYNQRLTSVIDSFQDQNTNVSSIFYDTNTLFQGIIDESGNNSKNHCDRGYDCKDLVWWDILHPSSNTHLKIAKAVYEKVLDIGW